MQALFELELKKMSDLDDLRVKLSALKLNVVAEATGIPYANLYNFATGIVVRPSYHTVSKVQEYLKENLQVK